MYDEINNLYYESMNGCNESREKLILKLKPLILSSVMKYFNDYSLYDDLIQEGYLVIIDSLNTYDKNKGVHLLGYLKMCLRFYYLNKLKEKNNILSLNECIKNENTQFIDLVKDETIDVLDIIIEKESTSKLYINVLNLTDRQRGIVIMYYFHNLSIAKISEKLNISYRTVVNTKKRALNKLKSM